MLEQAVIVESATVSRTVSTVRNLPRVGCVQQTKTSAPRIHTKPRSPTKKPGVSDYVFAFTCNHVNTAKALPYCFTIPTCERFSARDIAQAALKQVQSAYGIPGLCRSNSDVVDGHVLFVVSDSDALEFDEAWGACKAALSSQQKPRRVTKEQRQ